MHDCRQEAEYVATYGAPGIGQHWVCRLCGKDFTKIGPTLYANDEVDGPFELTLDDVR